nr:methyltransferase domain-containing protein [Aestuariivirga sp. YIM B02566]
MLWRTFLKANRAASCWIDSFLPDHVRQDGNQAFLRDVLPRALRADITVYDLGGGSRPCVDRELKDRLGLRLVGLDVSGEELAAAPVGTYDQTIVADLCTFTGTAAADSVICQATLEHVPDTVGAIRGLATCVRPGGAVYLFAPCRNAAFARINLILPEGLKRFLLFRLFPEKATGHDGFKAFYDHCTPGQIEAIARRNGLEIEERRLFWTSSYFFIFTPAYLLWRAWQGLSYMVLGKDAAESFVYVLRKSHAVALDSKALRVSGRAAQLTGSEA